MKAVTCHYYVTDSGRMPARGFVESLDSKAQIKFMFVKGLLEQFGKQLPRPHAKYLEDGIYEMRFRGGEGHIRVLYFFYHQNRAIFTNGFVKKQQKIPRNEKKTAARRKDLFIAKHGG